MNWEKCYYIEKYKRKILISGKERESFNIIYLSKMKRNDLAMSSYELRSMCYSVPETRLTSKFSIKYCIYLYYCSVC